MALYLTAVFQHNDEPVIGRREPFAVVGAIPPCRVAPEIGYEFTVTVKNTHTDARAALIYLKSAGEQADTNDCQRPDLIFLDINLPGMDGFEFLDEYHKLSVRLKSEAVVIMLTTSLNPDDQKRAMSYPEVSAFLNKPLTVEVIRETVEKYF